MDAAAEHITFLARVGELEEATSVFESFLPLALENTTPSKRFSFMLAGWLLLDTLRAPESTHAKLNLPASFDGYRSEAGYDLEALTSWFRDQTQRLARSFDARDETDVYTRRVSATIGRRRMT